MKFGYRPMLAAALMLGGCSSNIVVAKLDPGGPPPKGVPWNLAMTQYTLIITRQVTGCDLTLNGKVTVAVTQGKAVDPSMRYVLSSSGFWATSDITSGLAADGTSTSLNAHSEDQTAAVITNVVTTAAQIAVDAAGAKARGAPKFQCTPAVAAALLKLNPIQSADKKVPKALSLSDIVDADNITIVAATARVTQLVTDVQTDSSKKRALSLADEDLTGKTAKLTKDQADLTANLKLVQNVQTVVWPLSGDSLKSDKIFTLDESVAQKWIQWFVVQDGKIAALSSDPPPKLASLDGFDVSLALYRPDGANGWTTAPPSAGPDIKVGVPVRIAGLGRLLICTGATPCGATMQAGQALKPNESLPIKPDANVLQLGQMYVVPMTGGTFKSELAAISLDTNGNPTSIEIAEKTSVAAAATGSLAAGLTQASAIPSQIAAAKLAGTQAQTSQIAAENALVQTQANAKMAGATSEAVAQGAYATAEANLATAQANAQSAGPAGQLAFVTAQNNLAVAEAQSSVNLGSPDELATLTAVSTQTSLLTARANEINAETALAKAKIALSGTP